MKSEVMALAITGIDDKLIADAENISKKKFNFRPIYALCAVAACILLVFTFILKPQSNTSDASLLLNGDVIADSPVEIHLPATVYTREVNNSITLTLFLQTYEDTKITVSHGKMDIGSSENTDVIFTGTEYNTQNPVTINWYLDDTDINSDYKLTIGSDSVYTLSFDEATGLWSICKQ